MISNTQFIEGITSKLGFPYIYGGIGLVYSEKDIRELAKQYPSVYTSLYLKTTLEKGAGKQGFDCSGLLKYFLWGNPSASFRYDPATDLTADRLFGKAAVKGPIETMPDIPGVCVRYPGHVGCYAGKGNVIEARGVNYGVVSTRLSERPWTHWYQCPGVEYAKQPDIETWRETIQKHCGFSAPERIWAVVDAYEYGRDWYLKWAQSYSGM